MNLRIISGTLKRRYITVDKQSRQFRPTQERVRQSVAETLNPRIEGSIAADLCAGSGAFGLELVSRGAGHVDFVESDRGRARCIIRHCEEFGVAAQCRVIMQDLRRYLDSCTNRYDIIFFDPPYGDCALPALVPAVSTLLNPGGVLVYERSRADAAQGPLLPSGIFEMSERAYGDTIAEFIERHTTPVPH
jgi:16S rRNA (guanine966-N2)-methyltransferase